MTSMEGGDAATPGRASGSQGEGEAGSPARTLAAPQQEGCAPAGGLRARWQALPGNVRGGLYMLATALAMGVQSAAVKGLAESVDSIQTVFVRCALGLVLVLPLMRHELTRDSAHGLRRRPYRPTSRGWSSSPADAPRQGSGSRRAPRTPSPARRPRGALLCPLLRAPARSARALDPRALCAHTKDRGRTHRAR